MKAVVFAAGKGERLWPLTETTPKPLLPIAGRPIIERTLMGLVQSGIREIGLVTNHKEEKIREFVGDGKKLGFRATYIHQDSPLGTADALKSSQPWLEGERRFIVIYGDDYYSIQGIVKFVKTLRTSSDEVVATAEADDPSRFGRLEIKRGKVRSIQEKVIADGPAKVNAALYMLSDSFLKETEAKLSARGEYELTDAINQLIRSGGTVRSFPLRKIDWQGITYPWDLLEANQRELQSIRSTEGGTLEKGVKVAKPVAIGKGTVIRSGCYIEGPVVIGENSTIGPNSYVRPFTSIGRNCKVGASCEVKASILMDNAHVPHLSYVGDSVLGEGVSLGAGTITANLRFDNSEIQSVVKGKRVNSHRRKLGAIIGDRARTGINVSIFPGVKIGTGAWIWPGVSLKRDVAAGERVKEDAA